MPYQRGGRKAPPASTSATLDAEAFRLVAIQSAHPPDGCIGHDWLVYRIAQGKNIITGYRRGDLISATAEVESIVVGLNERRAAGKNRPGPKPKPPAGASAPPPLSPSDGQAS